MSNLCMILCGQMRTYDYESIINSYHKYLSVYGNIDLYICTWKNKGYSHYHGNHNTHAKQNDIMEEKDIIKHYSQFPFFTIKNVIIDDFETFQENLSVEMKSLYNMPFRNHANVSTSIPIEYKYQQAILCLTKTNDYLHYSNIICTRPDMEIICDLPVIEALPEIIYFKALNDRCMDHCWFGTPSTIIKQLHTIFDNYSSNYHKLPNNNQNNRDNNELLIYQCEVNNIQKQHIYGEFVRQHFFPR